AAGWYFARAHAPRLGSFGQNARWVRFAKMPVGFVSPKCAAPLALMLRGIAARRERSCFPSRRALRRGSTHEGVSVLILRDARPLVRIRAMSSGCALLRMRTNITANDSNNTPSIVPAARFFLRPGFASLLRSTQSRGRRSAERRSGAALCTRWAYHDAIRQALARRLASHDAGRSPLGAPPWRFWASGPRFRLLRRPPPYNGGALSAGAGRGSLAAASECLGGR